MEQKTSANTSSEKLDDSNNSPPQKRAKPQPEEISPPPEATSNDATTTAGNLNGGNQSLNHQPTNTANTDNQPPSRNGIFNVIIPSDEDSV